jgi:hypothetical protein
MKENKLIAEFMGMANERHSDGRYLFTTDIDELKGADTRFGEELYFHVSWDWLMPVVEKINNTTDEFGNEMDFQIGNGFVWVDHPIGNRIYFSGNEIDHKKEPMIDKVYKAVVEFIQWYNQKN